MPNSNNKTSVLFVCLGNICRSPLAEVVVTDIAKQRQLLHQYHFDSAGTGDWHIGCAADPRSIAIAAAHGLDLSQHRAMQITSSNSMQWDWLVAMDQDNRATLLRMGVPESRILMMRQFEGSHSETIADLPDPYYGGEDGFESAYQMLKANAPSLLDFLQSQATPSR